MSIGYIFLGFINLIIFTIYLYKDPVAATAIFVGVSAAMTISALITVVVNLWERRHSHK